MAVVYLAHTAMALPFGPAAYSHSEAGTSVLRRARAILTPSQFMKMYIKKWADLESVVMPIALFEQGQFPIFGRFDQGYLTIINPCEVEGISIFLALAEIFPQIRFAAVPGWGTTSDDLRRINLLSNISVLSPTDDMKSIYSKTRILLAPSLWIETWGRVVVEAMLHGIPVIASDSGGLPEAKLGVEFVVPVRTIQRFTDNLDSQRFPVPVVPTQEIEDWVTCVSALVQDSSVYSKVSEDSRAAALDFLRHQKVSRVLDFLRELTGPTGGAGASCPSVSPASHEGPGIAQLSPEKRALLFKLLAKDRAVSQQS